MTRWQAATPVEREEEADARVRAALWTENDRALPAWVREGTIALRCEEAGYRDREP